MRALSEDDLNLRGASDEELARAWDLWFDLAQYTNEFDPPHTHGVFLLCRIPNAMSSAAQIGEGGTSPRAGTDDVPSSFTAVDGGER